jgi:hypothetical protein
MSPLTTRSLLACVDTEKSSILRSTVHRGELSAIRRSIK